MSERKRRRHYDDSDDSDDSMPDMSSRAADSGARSAAAMEEDLVERVLRTLVDPKQPEACPFSLIRLEDDRRGLKGRDPALHARFSEQYDVHVKSAGSHPDGCACKGSQRHRLAELYHHARAMVRNEGDDSGTRGGLHAALVSYLEKADPGLRAAMEEAQAARAATAQPADYVDPVSWPPIMKIRANRRDPEAVKLLRYKQQVREHLSKISVATAYYPILGAARTASETSSFDGEVLLVFDGKGDGEKQDELLAEACILRDELNKAFFVEKWSPHFITKQEFERLRGKNVWKDLGGDQFANRLEWGRKLGEERQRIEKERKAKEERMEAEKQAEVRKREEAEETLGELVGALRSAQAQMHERKKERDLLQARLEDSLTDAREAQALKEALVDKDTELADARDKVEDLEDQVNPLSETNSVLYAKLDALMMGGVVMSGSNGDADASASALKFMREIKGLKNKRADIVATVKEFLERLPRPDVNEVGCHFTLSLAKEMTKDAVIKMILRSKFEA